MCVMMMMMMMMLWQAGREVAGVGRAGLSYLPSVTELCEAQLPYPSIPSPLGSAAV